MLLLRASSDISCVSWQIERALENDALHRGRKRKSETSSGHNDWTLEDDKALIRLVWSGAQGDDRKLPGRTARACKNRLQMIHKHVPKSWTHLHKQAPSITCIAERIMADTAWYEMIAAERQKLPKLSQDETLDKNGPGFLGSSDHASPAPSPQTPEIDVKLEDCTRRLLDACHHVSMDPNNSADRALDVCSSVARQVGMPTNTT